MLNKETIEEIRNRNDIVDVIAAYIPLKRAGNSFRALCPFHKEKTPSFNVHADRQMYYCFGCGKGGDVFSFLMEHDGLDFMGAARTLADRAGMVLHDEVPSSGSGPDKAHLFDVLSRCAQFFHTALLENREAQAARDYLDQRHLDPALIQSWGLGFAPLRPTALRDWAAKNNVRDQALEQTGMLAESAERPGDWYERFRGRLLFPIRDELGRVVGFSGRVMKKDAKGSKYVNTPETALFKKSRILFGLDRARKSIRDAGMAILCEGQIDVIRCHSAGFAQAVAPQGTSLTEDHARMLKRYTERVIMTFDGDAAGIKAAIRGAEILHAFEISVDVLSLPPGEDPDSLIREQGADAFDEVLHGAQPAVLFFAKQKMITGELQDPSRKPAAVKDLLAFVQTSPSAVQQESMLRLLAPTVGLTFEALLQDLHRLSHRRAPTLSRQEEISPVPPKNPPPPRAERELIGLLVDAPGLAELLFSYLTPEHFSHPACRNLFRACREEPELDREIISRMATGDASLIELIASLQFDSKNQAYQHLTCEDTARQLILKIRRSDLERHREDCRNKLKQAASEQAERLKMEGQQITLDLSLLRRGWDAAEPSIRIHSEENDPNLPPFA